MVRSSSLQLFPALDTSRAFSLARPILLYYSTRNVAVALVLRSEMAGCSVNKAELWLKWLLLYVMNLLGALWHLVLTRIHVVRLLAKMSGPRSYPLIGVALGPKSFTAVDILNYGLSVGNIYGRTFAYYLGPVPFVYTGEPDDLGKLLSSSKYTEKSLMYRLAHPWLSTGLLTSGGEKWRYRRKILTPAFHFKILDQFVPVFHSCGDEFVRQLRKRADGSAFNVWPLVELLTLDVICETAMGVPINAQTNSHSSYVDAVKQVSNMTVARMWQPWFYLDFIFKNTPTGRRYKRFLNVIHGTTERVIQERKAELELMTDENTTLDVDELGRRRRVAFLDLLLLVARDGSLSDADIREEVDTFMFAGHDTTACSIAFTMFLLSQNPHVQDQILAELESVFDPNQPLKPSLQELSELKYLEMVIKESLRLYPPAPIIIRQNAEDTTLSCGHVMPQGCSISISPLALHRDPKLYPEPEKFIPERFTPEECARRHPFAYLPFSAGPRNCIGQRFAMLELKSVLAKVVWNFRILPEPDFEPMLTWELSLKSANGVIVRLQDRK